MIADVIKPNGEDSYNKNNGKLRTLCCCFLACRLFVFFKTPYYPAQRTP